MDCISVAGNVVLTSTVEENGRQFACEGEMVTFTCQVNRSFSLQWYSPLIRLIVYTTRLDDPVVVSRSPFIATRTSIARSGFNSNFTSTLQVTASRAFTRNDTTVECRNQPGVNMSSRFTVAGDSNDCCQMLTYIPPAKQFTVSTLMIDDIISALNKATMLKMY